MKLALNTGDATTSRSASSTVCFASATAGSSHDRSAGPSSASSITIARWLAGEPLDDELRGLAGAGAEARVADHHDRVHHAPNLAMIWGRSIVVRMPGSAAHTTGTALTARLAV